MTSKQIRQQFLDFFASKEHAIVDSSPVVPLDDPTLMFTNAGMNQFKDVFLGTGSRSYNRVADTQKCIRAGGKHNDLDDVGQDTYHHTFFEMLGNWSFGDYFKKEAIEWAWELLTDVWGIEKDRLHATYFEGDSSEGLEPDTEAAGLWKSVTDIKPENVHPGSKKDNFWEMGNTGPCGPCSEIHVDLTPDKSGRALVNAGDPRVIELWNLVFIQFNRDGEGKLTPLPAKHVDTGMGFERLCAVLQGMASNRISEVSNYDTDVFTPIFEAIKKRTGAPQYTGTLPDPSRDRKGVEPDQSRDREGAEPDLSRDRKGAEPDQRRDRKGADDSATATRHPNVEGGPLAYLITFHTYGTWLHGSDRGSVDREHNVPGTPFLDPDGRREADEFAQLKHEAVALDKKRRAVVDTTIREVAEFRGWTIHALNIRTNHVHVVVTADVPPERVMNDFKSYSTRRMVEHNLIPHGTKAWTRHGSTRYLWNEHALEAAGRYAMEAQGDDLPLEEIQRLNARTSDASSPPLPHGRGSVKAPTHEQLMIDVSYRVIADHLRCLTFALTDGAIPSNEGRGYVMRRVLRRAVRYGRQYLDMHEPFLCDLVQPLIDHMADAFPELRTAHAGKNLEHVTDLIRDEEASFVKTLDRGIRLFNEAADYARKHHHGRIGGEDAFKLHDTYGFPIDLTEQMAEEQDLTVNFGEYERLMAQAREKARAGSKMDWLPVYSGVDPAMIGQGPDTGMPRLEGVHVTDAYLGGPSEPPATDDSPKYGDLHCEGDVQGWIIEGQIKRDPPLVVGQTAGLILDRTCFYAEQGGQVGDTGSIKTQSGVFRLDTTQVQQGVVIHVGRVSEGMVKSSQRASCTVDLSRRRTMKNHTSTHMLNWALREVLGDHIQQKGSLVDPEKTRFDFSHNKPMAVDEITRVESLVNEMIHKDLPVDTKVVDQKHAREINTLRAVFGEKYPDEVRVVSIGADIDAMLGDPKNPKWMKHPVEFCGGTHLKHSGEAERFVLISEEAVAKGIRRVVGITADAARQAEESGQALLAEAQALADPGAPGPVAPGAEPQAFPARRDANSRPAEELPATGDSRGQNQTRRCREPAAQGVNLASALAAFQQKVNEATIPVRVRHELRTANADLQEKAKQQQKQAAGVSGEAVMDRVKALLQSAETINGVKIVVGEVPAAPVDALRGAIDWVRNKTEASAVLLAMTTADNKVTLIAGMSKAAVKKGLKAGDLIKEVAPLVGGKGGGRPDMAQGGGNDPSGVTQVLARAAQWIGEILA